MPEHGVTQPENKPQNVETLINEVDGDVLEQNLLALAQIGGVVKEVGKEVAVSRLALSKEDLEARVLLEEKMTEAGMQVEHHPLGLIGTYPGENPNLPAVILMSHYDSVPNGGMYDGTVGVISGIEVIDILNKKGVRLPRSIIVLPVTGEESSRFNMALVGSRAIFQGLTDEELAAQRPGDLSLKEALRERDFNPDDVRRPRFTPDNVHAVLELHISQNSSLEQHGKDLGIVEAIAAPDRREMIIGDPIEPDTQEHPNTRYFRVSVAGQVDHSGATPMGSKYRADSLAIPASLFIRAIGHELQSQKEAGEDIDVSIGTISIKNQALNKIPGNTEFTVRVAGKKRKVVEKMADVLPSWKAGLDMLYQDDPTKRKSQSIEIEELKQPPDEEFYKSEDIMPRQMFAAGVIHIISNLANLYYYQKAGNTVGTVSTYNMNEKGQIILGIDIRSTDLTVRNALVGEMEDAFEKLHKGPYTTFLSKKEADKLPELLERLVFAYPQSGSVEISSQGPQIQYELKKLPGSGEPTLMDPRLVATTEQIIKDHNLGSYEKTFSPAGQDSQNSARAGIPTVMIFIPSRNNGASHDPREYSTPEDLERGTQALMALTVKLASEK